ncbi:hypothetical protein [Mariniphaga sediminis]|uniref:hypothetical protein n=1 Tax=Mariniphaga sediminis TaxID=1628158 RepID=UPI00356A2EE8
MANISEELIKEFLRKKINPKISLHEYFVDILGGLFPGILFLLALFIATVPPIFNLSCIFLEKQGNVFQIFREYVIATLQTPSSIWIVFFMIFTLLSYIVGHIFYRRDIKTPDRESFKLLKSEIEKEYMDAIITPAVSRLKRIKSKKENGRHFWLNLSLRKLKKRKQFKILNNKKHQLNIEELLRDNLACKSENDCQFPYPNYNSYLIKRNLMHLLDFTQWCEADERSGDTKVDRKDRRSKTYVNILKIRLRYFHPDKCAIIIRNEGHVRLASSTWHIAKIISNISWFGIGIVLLSCLLTFVNFNYSNALTSRELLKNLGWILPVFMAPFTILLLSQYLVKYIQKFIHYQRLREVFYVLETVYTAFSLTDELDRLKPLCDK